MPRHFEIVSTGIESEMAAFAAAHVCPAKGLGSEDEFPGDIWQALGQAGLLDPEALAPPGSSPCRSIARTGRVLAMVGGNLGLALSWMIHHLVAGCLVRPLLPLSPGTADSSGNQDNGWAERLWAGVRAGDATICLAVSEPDAGTHPKHMAAQAKRTGREFILSGKKAYLTNGPIASAYVVVAVTSEKEGRKAFSAFLVDRDTPGLDVSGPMDLPFLKPSPHGSMVMDRCRVGEERLLGREGRAFPDLVLLFRQLEDAVLTGPLTGAMIFILEQFSRALAGFGTLSPDHLETLGRLKTAADTAVLLSDQVAAMAGRKDSGSESPVLYFRQMAARFPESANRLAAELDIRPDPGTVRMMADLSAASGIGKNVARIKRQKAGRQLLSF